MSRAFAHWFACRQREFVGAIAIYRKEVRPFTDKQIGAYSPVSAAQGGDRHREHAATQRSCGNAPTFVPQTANRDSRGAESDFEFAGRRGAEDGVSDFVGECDATFGSMLQRKGVACRICIRTFHKQTPTIQWRDVSDLKRVVRISRRRHGGRTPRMLQSAKYQAAELFCWCPCSRIRALSAS